ncbi:MAG: HAMP domain-containing histidine kinase [Odoribacter sp.]|nr:HAMP domain-containing histidine kinase [Odoribacter sp.]
MIFFCYGIFYEDNEGDFVIITREKKEVLTEQLSSLLWILGLALIIGISAIIVLSRWMANRAYRPFRTVIRQVKNNISTNNLDKRIKLLGTNDELQDLIQTFNELLEKISETFIIQKNFVSYVSHEFKTPLASILGNLEVFSIKDRTSKEYHQLSQQLIQQIKQLEEILNTLMVISDLKSTTEINPILRIDEMIWEIISKISAQYRKSNISVHIEVPPQDENILFVSHDSTQLLMALFNLIENAVKYSQNKPVEIYIRKENEKLSISIVDKGIGIPAEQLKNISKPFYRADNTQQIRGSGIGLSIALNILEKNGIKYKIETALNEGTIIILVF